MTISLPHGKEIISLLQKLVQIPSVNPPGLTEDIIDLIITEVLKEKYGFENKIITHSKNGYLLHNLISKVGNGETKVILSGHFDVVPVGSLKDWTVDPFSGEIIGDYLYGRGSSDMKSGLVSLLYTIKTLSKFPQFLDKCTLVFVGTSDEELGMTGAKKVREIGLMEGVDLLIVAEPTDLKIGIAEKGLLWVKVNVKGKSAHGSMPQEGINAIEKALNLIPKFYNKIEEPTNSLLGKSTLNIGKIEGGFAINIVPDNVILELDYRLIPEANPDDLIEKLVKTVENGTVEIIKTLPALESDIANPFIKNLKRLLNTEYIGLPYATDAAELLRGVQSTPFVIFGPGDPRFIHKNDERVKISDVYLATKILTEALVHTY